LASIPVLVQANGDFFLKSRTAAMALRLLREDRIHLLGSDCHNMGSRRPNLGAAAQKILQAFGQNALDRIVSYESKVFGTE
jgi:protein-tyrosine phosphatase